jgi:hypothetical protein
MASNAGQEKYKSHDIDTVSIGVSIQVEWNVHHIFGFDWELWQVRVGSPGAVTQTPVCWVRVVFFPAHFS